MYQDRCALVLAGMKLIIQLLADRLCFSLYMIPAAKSTLLQRKMNDGKSLQIQIPEFPSNPAHVVHIVWLYCQCAKSLSQ
jgi:hypothetical protein